VMQGMSRMIVLRRVGLMAFRLSGQATASCLARQLVDAPSFRWVEGSRRGAVPGCSHDSHLRSFGPSAGLRER